VQTERGQDGLTGSIEGRTAQWRAGALYREYIYIYILDFLK